MKKIKRIHILIFLSIIVAINFALYFYTQYKENKIYGYVDYDYFSSLVEDIYATHPKIFNFEEADECIITVFELLKGQDDIDFDIPNDKEGNACIGYFIVNKDYNENIKVDSSHICDMVDY